MNHILRKNLQTNLLEWFELNGRALPWRRNRSLYGTWISEIMLQQTTVAVVIPFWEKFMKLFPDVHSLAAADEAEILSCWAGLGYYRRARNLHRAARMIVEDLQGEFPSNRKKWKELPGVGAYASGAIASIGLGEVVPAVDANARRVFCRWFFDDPVAAGNLKPAELEKIGAEVVHREKPGSWNEAVMELGATLCRAGTAECSQCPVVDQCRAGLAGTPLEIPPPKKTEQAIAIIMATVVVRLGKNILLLPPGEDESVPLSGQWVLGREDTAGLHQGLWKIPTSPWYVKTEPALRALEDPGFVILWLKKRMGLSSLEIQNCEVKMASFTHSITRYRLDIRTWEVLISKGLNKKVLSSKCPGQVVIVSDEYPVSNLVSKSLKKFHKGIV